MFRDGNTLNWRALTTEQNEVHFCKVVDVVDRLKGIKYLSGEFQFWDGIIYEILWQMYFVRNTLNVISKPISDGLICIAVAGARDFAPCFSSSSGFNILARHPPRSHFPPLYLEHQPIDACSLRLFIRHHFNIALILRRNLFTHHLHSVPNYYCIRLGRS